MFVEENEVVGDSAETTTSEDLEASEAHDASTTEDEVAKTTEGQKQQSGETPEQRRARIKRMYEREFGKQNSESSQEISKEGSKEVDERYARLELKTEGVTSKKAQDVVLEYVREARLLGKDIAPADALKSLVVREALAELEKKTSAPAPSKRTTAGATDSFEYWAAQAKKGNWPRHDRAMMDKLKKARIFTS